MSTANFDLAQAYLEGREIDYKKLKELVNSLKATNSFALARKVLDHAITKPAGTWDDKFVLWIEQQRALSTYKDNERPPEARFREALEILENIGLYRQETKDSETLGLGGAIYKRMWESDGNSVNIHTALSLYRAGWERDRKNDQGYCGVNAAFLLDTLAMIAQKATVRAKGDDCLSRVLSDEAKRLRQNILDFLNSDPGKEDDYWHLATLAELFFGLGNYLEAKKYLERACKVAPDDWKAQTTAKQLIEIARCQGVIPAPDEADDSRAREAWDALAVLLGENIDGAKGLCRGKVGLALSGGGFRASFFHLGTLARLAEVDALRHVETLSTVSGGSIVGVHYYLELKKLLETKSDLTITRDDYIALVRRVQEQFFKAVARNMRVRTLANLWCNLKMIFLKSYGRSQRIGELYESEIFSRVGDGKGISSERIMNDLLICPAGHDATRQFKPNDENWRRSTKVPVLLLNTTSLNSGHNFHFTATWMGEPPGLLGAEVDMNVRYRRLYYGDAPTAKLRCFRVGYAVAASSCVPALFEPLTLEDLYPGRTVRLVDGGVHDNQGVNGLLDESCSFILCSDASGQMHDSSTPGESPIGVLMRSDSILQDRVREAQYQDLAAREKTGALKGLFFIHLKKDLYQESVAWSGCDDGGIPLSQQNQTPYGIDRDIQRCLAELRTDLDSFTEVEAQSLMLSGYLMTDEHLRSLDMEFKNKGSPETWGGFVIEAPRGDWSFLRLAPIAAKPANSSDLRRKDLERQLKVGSGLFLKAFFLVGWLRIAGICCIIVLLALVVWLVRIYWNDPLPWQTWRAAFVATFILVLGAAIPMMKLLNPQTSKKNIFLKIGMAVVGYIGANIHLHLIDPLFKHRGNLERLCRLPAKD